MRRALSEAPWPDLECLGMLASTPVDIVVVATAAPQVPGGCLQVWRAGHGRLRIWEAAWSSCSRTALVEHNLVDVGMCSHLPPWPPEARRRRNRH
eukprot:4233426-Pyramimonas_sp.AAC.1